MYSENIIMLHISIYTVWKSNPAFPYLSPPAIDVKIFFNICHQLGEKWDSIF